MFQSHAYLALARAKYTLSTQYWPRLDPCWAVALSPRSISSSRLSTLASPRSLARWRSSTICQATLCSAGNVSRSSPKRPLCPLVASSSNTCAWKRRWRTVWGHPKPRQSVRRKKQVRRRKTFRMLVLWLFLIDFQLTMDVSGYLRSWCSKLCEIFPVLL